MVKLGEVGSVYSGLTGKTKKDFQTGNSKYITFLNVLNNNIINVSQLESVSVSEDEHQNEVRKGDIFFNGSSETPNEVGMCATLSEDITNTYLNSFCFGYRLSSQDILPLFLVYLLNGIFGRKIMSVLAQGATRYNLPKEQFLKIEIPIPSLECQHHILDSLSAIDDQIEALRRLIAKQEAIKKATLKLLLTPKKDWKMIRLGDVCETSSGGTPSRNVPEFFKGNYIWVTTSELKDCWIEDSNEHISAAGVAASSAKFFPENTVLLAMYGATIGKLGILKKRATTNQACCALMCNHKLLDYKFLYYLLLSKRKELIELGYGAGQPNISQQVVANLILFLPSYKEQEIISFKLTSIDEHLESLQSQLGKVENIKQGMMRYFFG